MATKLTKTERENVPVWKPGKGPINPVLIGEAIDAANAWVPGNVMSPRELQDRRIQIAIEHINIALANRGYR